MIYEGSRYIAERIVAVPDKSGVMQPAIYPQRQNTWYFRFDEYLAPQDDRFDLLAGRIYQDAERWWVISRANPEVFYPDDIAMGSILRIPNVY